MKCIATTLALCSFVAGASPAVAHHSGAMFDRTKQVTIVGTVKELQWSNPHAWLEVLSAPDASGKTTQWSFEFGGGAGSLVGMGLTKQHPAPGDKVTVEGYPLRDGRPGASFKRMTLADGVYPRGQAIAPTGAPAQEPGR